MKGSYYEILHYEQVMIARRSELQMARFRYHEAKKLLKMNQKIKINSSGREFTRADPHFDGRMLIEYECTPICFYGYGTNDKKRMTLGEFYKYIRALKDKIKQKNREYSKAYEAYIEISEGSKNFEKRKKEIKNLEDELKEAKNQVVRIENRLAVLKK